MKTLLKLALFCAAASAAFCQSATNVRKLTGTATPNELIGDLVLPSGGKITIASGATLEALAGSTLTGFGSGGGGIGGTLGASPNVVPRTSGTGGATLQSSLVTIDNTGGVRSDHISAFFAAQNSGVGPSELYSVSLAASGLNYTWKDSGGSLWLGALLPPLSFPGEDLAWFLPATNGTLIGTGDSSTVTSVMIASVDLATKATGVLAVANGGTGQTTALLPSMGGNGGKFLRVNAGATDYEVTGKINAEDGSVSAPGLSFAAATNTGLYRGSSSEVYLTSSGKALMCFDTNALYMGGAKSGSNLSGFAFSTSDTNPYAATDFYLQRDAANRLCIRDNGSSASAIRIYGNGSTFTAWVDVAHNGTDMVISTSTGVVWQTGTGSPEGVITGSIGSLFVRTDTGDVYRKTSGTGNTGWVTP